MMEMFTLGECVRISVTVFIVSFLGLSFLYENIDNEKKKDTALLALSRRSPKVIRHENDFHVIRACTKPGRMLLQDNTFCTGFSFEILHHPSDVCKGTDVTFFIVVTSQPNHFRTRDIIRRTWLTASDNASGQIRHLFLVGTTPDSGVMNELQIEVQMYNDILVGNFLDHYRNITLKTIMGIRYYNDYCRHAAYFMKCDDDVFVNTPQLINHFTENVNQTVESMYGACYHGTTDRNPASEFYLSHESFPDGYLPHYCLSSGYVISHSLAIKINRIISRMNIIPVEHVFVGMCVRRLSIQFSGNVDGFHVPYDSIDLKTPSGYIQLNAAFTIHGVPPQDMDILWMASLAPKGRPLIHYSHQSQPNVTKI